MQVFKLWKFASNQLWASLNSTIAFPICMYLVLKTNLLQRKTPLCIYLHVDTFGPQQRDRAHFGTWVAVTSNHLNITSAWKSLVATCSCVCVLKFQHKLITHLSPTWNTFISYKRAHMYIFKVTCANVTQDKILQIQSMKNYEIFLYPVKMCTLMVLLHQHFSQDPLVDWVVSLL